jgi:hypothetical protein
MLRSDPNLPWSWKLVPLRGSWTRLIIRLKRRYSRKSPNAWISALVLLEFGDFPMIRRVRNGIKARAESAARARGPENDARREG